MTREQCYFLARVKINKDAPLFAGERATIAYIGDGGVSVYLRDSEFDDCIPLNYGEFELDDEKRD